MREKRQATETAYEKAQMTDLTGKDFKTSTIKMFKEQKESMIKEVKKSIKTRSHQIPNTNKEIEIIFLRNQTKILDLKSIITKIKITQQEIKLYLS